MLYILSEDKTIIDLINFLIIFLIFLYFKKKNFISNPELIFFSIYTSLPVILNENFVDTFVMWDQIKYANNLIDFRIDPVAKIYEGIQSFEDNKFGQFINLNIMSFLYAFFPFPIVNSINAITLINKFLLISSLIFFRNNKFLTTTDLIIVLLLPITIFYSNFALTEIFMLVLSMWLIYFFYKKKYIFSSLIFLIAFAITSFFPIFLIGILLIIETYLFFKKKNYNKIVFLIGFIIFFLLVYFSDELLIIFSKEIMVYKLEEMGWNSEISAHMIKYYNFNFYDLFELLSLAFKKFFLIYGGLSLKVEYKLLFLAQNIIIISALVYAYSTSKKEVDLKFIIYLLIILPVLIIFIIIENYFTLNRYLFNVVLIGFFLMKFQRNIQIK